ncbi:hypothetical protein AAKU55_004242 [Oxalobacteraceae bacterium GrIS 1.11]
MQTSKFQTTTLQRIDIAAPCSASWDAMQGNARVRHCSTCDKSVFNLSAMREADARALLADNTSGNLCVRFYQREDGTVRSKDTAIGVGARKLARKLHGLASMALLAFSVAGCGARQTPPTPADLTQPASDGAHDSHPDTSVAPAGFMMGAPPPMPAPEAPMMGKPVAPRPAQP